MNNLKEKLIKLGSDNPELQKNIRPILDHLSRTAYSDGDYGDQSKNRSFYPDDSALFGKEALIQLGSDSPELQDDLRPVLDYVSKRAKTAKEDPLKSLIKAVEFVVINSRLVSDPKVRGGKDLYGIPLEEMDRLEDALEVIKRSTRRSPKQSSADMYVLKGIVSDVVREFLKMSSSVHIGGPCDISEQQFEKVENLIFELKDQLKKM